MIIATIGNQDFLIDTLSDAEQLLQILHRAQPIDDCYDSEYRTYYHPDNHTDASINISTRELVTIDEHLRRSEERRARDAAKAAAADPTVSA